MEKELIFHILQLPPTKDETVIQTAYRTLLKSVNPEDDPEGFKRLRQAYEEALVLSRRNDDVSVSEDRPLDEMDLWIQQVERLYLDITLRHRKDLWEELLSNPLCDSLDTSLGARAKMLEFLMDHCHLPHDIWKMIDDTFFITENIDTLKEQYPANFLNYMKYYVKNDTFIPYEFFTCENRSNTQDSCPDDNAGRSGDAYIDSYLSLKGLVDSGDFQSASQALEDIKAFGIYHPYEDVERLRLCLAEENPEKAFSLAEELRERCPDNTYVRLYLGETEWVRGRQDAAYKIWESILAEIPGHYTAIFNMVRYLIETKDYYNAREKIMQLLEMNSNDEQINEFLKTANDALIPEFRQTLEAGREDPRLPGGKLTIELGWCLFQNECMEEALQLMKDFTPDEGEEYGYHNLYGRLLYQSRDYANALPHLEKWRELIQQLTDDGTAETAKRISRLPEAYYILGSCYHELNQPEKAEQYLQEGIKAFPDSPRQIECMQYLAHILLKYKQYEKAVDVCDAILSKNESYYPAYLVRQESFFELKNPQAVVNDYHNAVDIYPGYHRPYLLAAEVFSSYGQYEDVQKVFSHAGENEVALTPRMRLLEAQALRNLAESDEDRAKAMRILDKLESEPVSENNDIEDLSEISFERCLLHWDNNNLKCALDSIVKAIREHPGCERYHYVCGCIYLDMEKYNNALIEYSKTTPLYLENPALYYNQGLCYEGMKLRRLAAENYEKAVELEDGYRNACVKLSDYYEEEYNTYNRPEDLDRSIHFISRMIKLYPESGSLFMHRGLIYYNSLLLTPAIADFEKLLELEPDNCWAWNNLACCYRSLKQFDKAIGLFQKAIECAGSEETPVPHKNMGDCCRAIADYRAAIRCYEKVVALSPEEQYYWEQFGHVYSDAGEYGKALEAYKKTKDRSDYHENIALVYLKTGSEKKCIFQLNKALLLSRDTQSAAICWSKLGTLYLDTLGKYKKAVFCFRQAARLSSAPGDLFDYERHIALCYYLLHKSEMAAKHARISLEHFNKWGKTIDNYISYRPYKPIRAGIFAKIYMCLGDDKKAMEYFQIMDAVNCCKKCLFPQCYEQRIFMGEFYLGKGDLKNALAQYMEAQKRYPGCTDACLQIKRLKKTDEKIK